MSTETISQLKAMRQYFQTGATKTHDFRLKQLMALKQAVADFEEDIYAALFADLKKARKNVGLRRMDFSCPNYPIRSVI